MVLRVPVDAFEDGDGRARRHRRRWPRRARSAEDVTTQLIDVEARVQAQQASVERVRQLLAQAQTIRDIMAIEAELAQRQAELDSLDAAAGLPEGPDLDGHDQGEHRAPAGPEAPRSRTTTTRGFVAGLAAGWDGLKTTVVAVATVVGALLPFAVVVPWSASRSGCSCVGAQRRRPPFRAGRPTQRLTLPGTRLVGDRARLHEAR